MRAATVLGASIALLATPAVAAPGDALVVTGEVVNVRAGPGMGEPVLFHAYRDQQAEELERTGEWIHVTIPGQPSDGWIHQSLLQIVGRAEPAASEAPAPAPDARPEGLAAVGGAAVAPSLEAAAASSGPAIDATVAASESDPLARFQGVVQEFNARALALAGVELFSGADPAGDGAVQVRVTDAWDLVPPAGRTSYTNALFDRWRAAAGGSGRLRVEVVDPSGAVVSEKSGPGTL
jgi:hypothetical protein